MRPELLEVLMSCVTLTKDTPLAIFSTDDVNGNLRPQTTTVTNNPREIAETFWAMFQAAERGEKVESRCTNLFIRTGLTVPSRSIPL